MSGTELITEPRVTELDDKPSLTVLDVQPRTTELVTKPTRTTLETPQTTTTILETTRPGRDGAAGVSLRDYAFSLGCRARRIVYLNYGVVGSNMAPLVMSTASQLRSLSIRVDAVESVDYILRVLVNSIPVAELTLPAGELSAYRADLTEVVAVGSTVALRLERSTGQDPSTFRAISASIEIVET